MLLNTKQVRNIANVYAKNFEHTYTDKTSKHNPTRRSVVYAFTNKNKAEAKALLAALRKHFAGHNVSNPLKGTTSEIFYTKHYVRIIADIA